MTGKTRRRLDAPAHHGSSRRHEPGPAAHALAAAQQAAVREHGSNSGRFLAFNPHTGEGVTVADSISAPRDTVLTRLSWGRLSAEEAQVLLEHDAWIAEDGTLTGRES